MSLKKIVFFVILVLLAWGIFLRVKPYIDANNVETDKGELVFLTQADKEEIFKTIDSTTSLADFDSKLITTFTLILDKYNANRQTQIGYLISPEFVSDHPTQINVITDGYKKDLIDDLKITSLTEKDLPDLKKFTKIFFDEYSKYPLNWMKYITPPVIVFAKSLSANDYKNEVIGGAETGVVAYNISGFYDTTYTKHLIHHELMHWFDTKKGMGILPWPQDASKYTLIYKLKDKDQFKEHPADGFTTLYSMTNEQEDKAETYAYLFTGADSFKLAEWIKTDEKLKNKVEYIKNAIKKRVSKMDDSYFRSLQ